MMRITGAVAAAVWLAMTLQAAAEQVLISDPGMRMTSRDFDGDRLCLVTLSPDAGTRGKYPRIKIGSRISQYQRDGNSYLYLIVEPIFGARDAVGVAADRRFNVKTSERFQLGAQPMILQALLAGKPVHLTSRMRDGTLRTSRFAAPKLARAISYFKSTCFLASAPTHDTSDPQAADERRLRLSRAVLWRITLLLHRRYGLSVNAPKFTGTLSDSTRRMIARYARESGMRETRYLNPPLLQRLMLERHNPLRWSHRRAENFRMFGNWYVYSQGSGRSRRCHLETEATSARGAPIWKYPHIQFWVRADGPRGKMYVNILTPSVLNLTRRRAIADIEGDRYILGRKGKYVWPVRRSGAFAPGFVRSLRWARILTIRGIEDKTGEDIEIRFSARGFTAGFDALMALCRRYDLRIWE